MNNDEIFFEDEECVLEATERFYSSGEELAACGCQVACRKTEYPVSISSSAFPTRQFAAAVYNTSVEEARENLVQVSRGGLPFIWPEGVHCLTPTTLPQFDLYYETVSVFKTEERPVYGDLWDTMGVLGGSLSIFLGMCLISLAELLEFLLSLLCRSSSDRLEKNNDK